LGEHYDEENDPLKVPRRESVINEAKE